MKSLVYENPQAFADWLLKKQGLTFIRLLPTELKGYDLMADAILLLALKDGEEVILLIEFQSTMEDMGDRLLDYVMRIRKLYKKEVIAFVIFLRKESDVSVPPLIWSYRNGEKYLVFKYIAIKMWELDAEDLLAFNQPALLPLTLLTKRGANRVIIEEMFATLIEHNLTDILPACNLLANLALRLKIMNGCTGGIYK